MSEQTLEKPTAPVFHALAKSTAAVINFLSFMYNLRTTSRAFSYIIIMWCLKDWIVLFKSFVVTLLKVIPDKNQDKSVIKIWTLPKVKSSGNLLNTFTSYNQYGVKIVFSV